MECEINMPKNRLIIMSGLFLLTSISSYLLLDLDIMKPLEQITLTIIVFAIIISGIIFVVLLVSIIANKIAKWRVKRCPICGDSDNVSHVCDSKKVAKHINKIGKKNIDKATDLLAAWLLKEVIRNTEENDK